MIQSLCNTSQMLILIVNVLPPREQPEPPQLWGAEGHHDGDSVAAVVSAAACVVGARWQIGRMNFSYLSIQQK
jgi:hypothetical protein